ncbi:MAG: hypothetical protein LBJ00_02475, partial [Planctomycetaceae bacterium]|nr:hypothetical protein [Planctomycetaceae bacterium]
PNFQRSSHKKNTHKISTAHVQLPTTREIVHDNCFHTMGGTMNYNKADKKNEKFMFRLVKRIIGTTT